MRYLVFYLILFLLLTSCNNGSITNDNNTQIKELEIKCQSLENRIRNLSDSLELLRFPASDRLLEINNLITDNNLNLAKTQIQKLKTLFPLSEEASKSEKLESIILQKEERIRLEDERIKALGYKAFTDSPSASVGNVSFKTSGFTFGRTFTFDYCNDIEEYYYRTADKDNVYLLVSLVLSTKEKYASVPNFGLYEIKDGNLVRLGYFNEEFASWSSYGAKLGNYHENSHDFSKVNSVNYKLAAEISIEKSKGPLLMLVKKDASSTDEALTLEDVKNNYVVVKILNRNRL